jgi:two-component system LytT family response regulator
MKPLRVLVVDDEPLARQRLTELLREQPDVEIVGYATNGAGAIDEIRELDPDLVFLDVQMPGKTGLDVVRELGPDELPATIFVTAFDQYALNAFDVAAVDYLVKPFDDERFEQAFRRARRLIELEQVGQLAQQLRAVLRETAAPAAEGHRPAATPARYLERVAVESRGQVRVVAVKAIDYISASGAYVLLHADKERFVVRERLQELEDRLDPASFFRIHRSTIVQVDRIEALLRAGGGDYAVRLKGGTELKVSRGRFEELERRLGM